MSIPNLTAKVCWLLGVCGFLRPSDISRIDLDHCNDEGDAILILIVHPKETRHGIHQDRTVRIKAHSSDPVLCPVQAWRAYRQRHARLNLHTQHDVIPSIRINPLIRYAEDPSRALSSQRISKYIQSVMDHVKRPEGHKRIKARALGSTRAAEAGMSADDIITHGHWASPD
ncbi:hypothetical protein BGZ73_002136, partial [Actinomortierella ambigua]